jgi:hypothetical protein
VLRLRKEIISEIVASRTSHSVESVLYDALRHRFKNGTDLKRIIWFARTLEHDLRFELQQNISVKEKNNLLEAVRLIKEGINIEQLTHE